MLFSRIILLSAIVFVASSITARAQSDDNQILVGAHYSELRLDYPEQTRKGIGAWLTYEWARWIGIENDWTFYPTEDDTTGWQWQVLIGPRLGWRAQYVGVFAKGRVGQVHFSKRFQAPETPCPRIFPTPESCLVDSDNLIFDYGGILEIYPTSFLVLRVDAGIERIRFGRDNLERVWTDNRQINFGAGWRF